MALEEEVPAMLITGYSIVMGFTVLVVIRLWITHKNSGFPWLLGHFALFTWAISFWMAAIDPSLSSDLRSYGETMMSEDNSFLVGLAGLIWAMSMFCLLVGIKRLSEPSEKRARRS